MLKYITIFLFALICGTLLGDDLTVAREALRDGIWEVARSHARKVSGEEARLIILESFAREERWDDLLKELNDSSPANEAFSYYKALALMEKGDAKGAGAILEGVAFKSREFAPLSSALKAKLALKSGDKAKALELAKASGFEHADANSRMVAADILAEGGDMNLAKKIWSEVASMEDAPLRAVALAAANLSDATRLRKVVENAQDAETRRFAALKLGSLLVSDASTFDEGSKLIRSIVKDAPDADGAMEADIRLGEALLERKSWREAADLFADAMEIWPEAAQSAQVCEDAGWALKKLGKADKALELFKTAEEKATDIEARSRCALAQGDILSESGKGDEAMAKYRMVLESFPDSQAARELKNVVRRHEIESKGRELYNDYRFAEAQKVFEELAKTDPDSLLRAKFFLILCLYGQGLDQEAEELAKEISLNPEPSPVKAEAILWLAKYAFNSRRWTESATLFKRYAQIANNPERSALSLVWSARASFAENDFQEAISLATSIAKDYPNTPAKASALVLQSEALMELGRYDEAILVLERTLLEPTLGDEERLHAEVLKADSLFALGADNSARFLEALDAYRSVLQGEALSDGLRLAVSFKMGRTLEKLKRTDEAIDQYYTGVVLAYREGRQRGVQFDDEARAAFSRAAFRLADEYESRGKDFQAMHILELVIASDVPAAAEAEKRLERIQTKGKFL